MKTIIVSLLLLIFSLSVFANQEWRTPLTSDLVYFELETGTVVIELAPFMAPNHVARFKALIKKGYYDGLDFYRVIDGFVAQAGDMTQKKPTEHKTPLKAEFSRAATDNSDFLLVQSPDFKAPQTGYVQGFAAGRDPKTNQEWLLHCPGAVAFARTNDIDSATTEFYIVIGQAIRQLDRNMSTIGRVIYGMPAVQALNRADMNNPSGVIEQQNNRSKILWAKLATDIEPTNLINVQVQQQDSEQVKQRLSGAKSLDNAFYHFKGNGNIDLCYYQLKTRVN